MPDLLVCQHCRGPVELVVDALAHYDVNAAGTETVGPPEITLLDDSYFHCTSCGHDSTQYREEFATDPNYVIVKEIQG